MEISKIYSHRGNLDGPDEKNENNPEKIKSIINKYKEINIEVDVWFKDDGFYLGHSDAIYFVDKFFFFNNRILAHCKDIRTFNELIKYNQAECFYQGEDCVSVSSKGKIIYNNNIFKDTSDLYYLSDLEKSIFVYLKKDFNMEGKKIFGICTDYPLSYNEYNLKRYSEKIPFELLIIDIDGVMTNGKKAYDKNSNVLSKEYCDKDFTAIKRFKASGIKICFLSGDKNVNEIMAKKRNIDFYYARDSVTGNIDKSCFLEKFKEIYGDVEMAYIGDDYYDLSIINNLKYTFCPSCACEEIKSSVYRVLETKAGEGAIAEIYNIYKDHLDNIFPYDSLEENK